MKIKLFFLLLILAAMVQVGCKKNDNSGPPVIRNIRVVDTTKRDSSFLKAYPGTLIVIQGVNLGGLKAVLFNDTSAYFNPVYATNTNIIVTIPATAQTLATNPKVPNVIKLVTDHGTTTFAFTLVEPPPYITGISFDDTGTEVFIKGANFKGISKITFPGGDTALGYTVNKDYTQISALIPAGSGITDSLRVYVTYGVASYPFPPPMTILSVSNENAVAGDTITLTGNNFVVINKVIFPGGIAGTNLHVVNVTKLTVVVPAGITTADTLRINGVLGTAASTQLFDSYINPSSPGYLTNFENQNAGDNTGFVGWTGGYADAPTASSTYPGGTGAVGFIAQGSPMTGNTNPGSQGNPGFVQLNSVPWVGNTGANVSDYSLKFELYTKKPWSAGALWIMMGGWYGWHDYLARYAPWSSEPTGVFNPGGWVTVTIPLTQFVSVVGAGVTIPPSTTTNTDNNEWDFKSFPVGGVPAVKFSDYKTTALCFTVVNDQASPTIAANALNIAIDNVRIVKGK